MRLTTSPQVRYMCTCDIDLQSYLQSVVDKMDREISLEAREKSGKSQGKVGEKSGKSQGKVRELFLKFLVGTLACIRAFMKSSTTA